MFRVGQQILTGSDILSRIHRYQLTTPLLQGMILDEAIAEIDLTAAERQTAVEAFWQQHRITSPEVQAQWLSDRKLTRAELESLAIRPELIEKFKIQRFGSKIESYFLTRKASLDQVVCSMIRVKEPGIAQELYFRIQAREQSFHELARQYSQGGEANTWGLIGPVALGSIHPTVANLLTSSQPGQLRLPIQVEQWFMIVRLEKLFPAQLDELTRRRLINELFEQWLEQQMRQLQLQPLDSPLALVAS